MRDGPRAPAKPRPRPARPERTDGLDHLLDQFVGEAGEEGQRDQLRPYRVGYRERPAELAVWTVQVGRLEMDSGGDAEFGEMSHEAITRGQSDYVHLPGAADLCPLRRRLQPLKVAEGARVSVGNLAAACVRLGQPAQLHQPNRGGDVAHMSLEADLVDVVVPPEAFVGRSFPGAAASPRTAGASRDAAPVSRLPGRPRRPRRSKGS